MTKASGELKSRSIIGFHYTRLLKSATVCSNSSEMLQSHPVMKGFDFKFPRVAHIGNTVSHAKNRKSRTFKYNLHTVTILVDGKKRRLRVPTKILRMMKKSGVTTHYKPEEKATKK